MQSLNDLRTKYVLLNIKNGCSQVIYMVFKNTALSSKFDFHEMLYICFPLCKANLHKYICVNF